MDKHLNRRDFLGKSLLTSTFASATAGSLEEGTLLAALRKDGADQAGESTKPSQPNYELPCGKLGDLSISRMIMGGNLIGGWAHSRDLIYVSKLFKVYNTEEKIFETMKLAEEHGINTVLLNPAYLDTAAKYNSQHGGKLQVISEIHVNPEGTTERQIKDEVKRLIGKGASTIYIQGMVGDRLVRAGRIDLITKTMEAIKNQGLTAGVGSHTLKVPMVCEQEKVPVDYYVKTLHQANYWSASLPEHRKEWFEKGYHDNVWCTDAEKTKAFMKDVKKPWFAFKVLAAGAIHPKRGFRYAFESGADFIVVGMFDFQIEMDVMIASKVLRRKGVKNREREWMA